MSSPLLAEFEAEHRMLVLTAVEWRALQADPAVMADQVFDALGQAGQPFDLHRLYQVIEQVVTKTYQDELDKRTYLSQLAGTGRVPVVDVPQDTAELAQLRQLVPRLSQAHRATLQLIYWDELTLPELAFVQQIDPAKAATKLASATTKFAAQIQRHTKKATSRAEVAKLFRSLKPGIYHRWDLRLW